MDAFACSMTWGFFQWCLSKLLQTKPSFFSWLHWEKKVVRSKARPLIYFPNTFALDLKVILDFHPCEPFRIQVKDPMPILIRVEKSKSAEIQAIATIQVSLQKQVYLVLCQLSILLYLWKRRSRPCHLLCTPTLYRIALDAFSIANKQYQRRIAWNLSNCALRHSIIEKKNLVIFIVKVALAQREIFH